MVYTSIKDLKAEDYQGNLKKAVKYLLNHQSEFNAMEAGKYEVDDTFFYMIQEYNSKDTTPWESHKKYIDIQLVLSGEEIMDVTSYNYLTQIGEYDEAKDWCSYEGDVHISMLMKEGDLAIFFPEDAHQPGLKSSKGNIPIRKCLFKVLI